MSSPSPPRWARPALVAALIALAVVPWGPLVTVLPWGADATKWTGRAAGPDPWGWILLQKHFVGYRPVTALSFLVNQACTGYAPWGYRLFDLASYAAVVAGLTALYRRWFGDSLLGAAVAGLALLSHPVVEEVVPFPSRRSYLLACAFGLWGLVAHDRSLRAERGWAWSVATGAALLSAVLSNEIAYVFLPLVPLRTAIERGRVGTVWPTVGALFLGVAARAHVLGSVGGGYQRHFFALVDHGAAAWVELPDWAPARIAVAHLRYLFVPNGPGGEGPAVPLGLPQDFVALAAIAWVGSAAVALPLSDPRPEVRRRWLLAAWMAGSGAIVVLSQTWFWRQAWAAVLPLALLAGATVAEAAAARTWGARALALGSVVWIGLAVPFGPLLGPHWGPLLDAVRGTRLVEGIEALDTRGANRIWFAVGDGAHTAQIARIWLDLRAGARGRHGIVASYPVARKDRGRITLTTEGDTRWLALSPGLKWADGVTRLVEGGRLRADALWVRHPPGRTWLVVDDRDGMRSWELVEPADGAVLPELPPADEPPDGDD